VHTEPPEPLSLQDKAEARRAFGVRKQNPRPAAGPRSLFSNRNSVTSVVLIEVFAFPIRNITLILKRRAKATCEAIPSARAFALLVCGELSDCDPPMCFKLFVSSAVPSVAFLSSPLIALRCRTARRGSQGCEIVCLRQGQRRSSAKNPLHDLLLVL
jgi:hypothetical protein